MSRDFNSEYENKEMLGNNYEPEADEEANPYLANEDDQYDSWREGCSEEFDADLSELIKKYLAKKQHYMNSLSHLVTALRSQADYIEKYSKEFSERCKK